MNTIDDHSVFYTSGLKGIGEQAMNGLEVLGFAC